MSNIGRKISDHYCNNFFNTSNNYDLGGAEIIAEGEDWIVVRQEDGKPAFASFEEGWQKNEKQKMIDQWCNL